MPSKHNGAPILKHVETIHLHCDSSSFGWGSVLYDYAEVRGFYSTLDTTHHIAYKELKAVRCAI